MKKCLLFLLFAPAVMSAMDYLDFDQFDHKDTADTKYITDLREQLKEIIREPQMQDRIEGLKAFVDQLGEVIAEKSVSENDQMKMHDLTRDVRCRLSIEQGRAARPVGAPRRPLRLTLFGVEAPTEVDQQDPVSDDMSE